MALPWISLTTVEALETALETTGKKLFQTQYALYYLVNGTEIF